MNKPDETPFSSLLEERPITPENLTSEQAALLLNTPKKAVSTFLTAWQFRMFQAMFTATTRTWKAKHTVLTGADWLSGAFSGFELLVFGNIEPDPDPTPSPEIADFIVPVKYTYDGQEYDTKRYIRVIRETAPYRPGPGPGAYWGVNPLSALREVKE